jgi:hypothetical protein
MTYEEAKALAEKPPLPVDQAFALYRAAVRTALLVFDRYTEAIAHRDVKLSELIHNRDMTSAAGIRANAERELNRSIVAEYRRERANGAK